MKKTMVSVELRNGVMFGEVINYDGQNVYVDVNGITYKFHVDQVTEMDMDKYYIVEEKQTKDGVKFNRVLSATRSTRKLGYQLIEKMSLPRLEAFHKPSQGLQYDGQWYYNCRKGSTIVK